MGLYGCQYPMPTYAGPHEYLETHLKHLLEEGKVNKSFAQELGHFALFVLLLINASVCSPLICMLHEWCTGSHSLFS